MNIMIPLLAAVAVMLLAVRMILYCLAIWDLCHLHFLNASAYVGISEFIQVILVLLARVFDKELKSDVVNVDTEKEVI